MVTVSQNQALQRWDTLQDDLREALLSEVNSDFIWKTCESEHVPDAKIYDIARIFSHVLLGFIHPEDMAAEIKELDIVPQIADSVSSAISKRIFEPLKDKLASIYEPPSKFEIGEPRVFEEIKKTFDITQGKPAPFSFAPTPSPAKTAPQPPTIKAPLGEFEKLGKSFGAVAPSVQAAKDSEPPPTIIHREESFAGPSSAESKFKIGIPLPKISEAKPDKSSFLRPAVLELGIPAAQAKQNEPPIAAAKPPQKEIPRVVHYTSLKTPLEEIKMPLDVTRDKPPAVAPTPEPTKPQPPKPQAFQAPISRAISTPPPPLPSIFEKKPIAPTAIPPMPPKIFSEKMGAPVINKIEPTQKTQDILPKPPIVPQPKNQPPVPQIFQQQKIQPPPPVRPFETSQGKQAQGEPPLPMPKKEIGAAKGPDATEKKLDNGPRNEPLGEFEKMKMLAKEWKDKAAPQPPATSPQSQPKQRIEPPPAAKP